DDARPQTERRPAQRRRPRRALATPSFLLAEETPGPEDEDGAHHRVHDDHGRLRQVEGAPRLGGADDDAPPDRTADPAQPPRTHPPMLPSPPMTTTTKASTMTPMPIPR